MAQTNLAPRIDAIRRFNRFYTRAIGVLQEGFLDSSFSLAEGRVLYELAHREKPTATVIRNSLGLDAGYLSRILSAFEKRGLVEKTPSEDDGRQSLLALTDEGRRQFAPLEARSIQQVSRMLEGLSENEQSQLISAMQTIARLLAGEKTEACAGSDNRPAVDFLQRAEKWRLQPGLRDRKRQCHYLTF